MVQNKTKDGYQLQKWWHRGGEKCLENGVGRTEQKEKCKGESCTHAHTDMVRREWREPLNELVEVPMEHQKGVRRSHS